MSDNVMHATDGSFDADVLENDKPVLVDFWAPWCSPCLAIAPLLDEIADEYKDKLAVIKVDVQDNQAIGSKYKIRTIPNLMIIKDGQIQAQLSRAPSKRELVEFIDSNI